MDLILMGTRDARRLGVVQAAVQGRITNREGAEAVNLSVRQFQRLRRRVREQGVRGLVHGNRGRPSAHRLAEAVCRRVVELLTGAVKLNDHHIADCGWGSSCRPSGGDDPRSIAAGANARHAAEPWC